MEYAVLIVSILMNGVIAGGAIYALHTFQERARAAEAQHTTYFVEALDKIVRNAASERSELEDRLMAVTKPEQLTLFKATEDPTVSKATYVDEETEYSAEEGEVIYVDPEAQTNRSAGN